jgi:hypothetical protein
MIRRALLQKWECGNCLGNPRLSGQSKVEIWIWQFPLSIRRKPAEIRQYSRIPTFAEEDRRKRARYPVMSVGRKGRPLSNRHRMRHLIAAALSDAVVSA